jgi:gluconolactonase
MRLKSATIATVCASILGVAAGGALAQPAAAPAPTGAACIPASAKPAPFAGQRGMPEPRDLTIKAIPGVVAGGGAWTKVWQQGGNSADGLLPDPDGPGVLVAQEDYDTILRISPDGKATPAYTGVKGIGSMTRDRKGVLYAAHRTEHAESTKADRDAIVNALTEVAPTKRVITDTWDDGKPLTLRNNDIAADGAGGLYVTGGCLYHATSKGVSVLADNLRTNGVILSPDDKVLYVTNGPSVTAFDVAGPGKLTNRRDFARLEAGGNGDGLAVDTEGRLYVTSGPGVQVFDRTGKYLGLIPTPRGLITIAFAGPGKSVLYVVGSGADENGQPVVQGPQHTAATLYRLQMLSKGLTNRAK